MERIKVAHVITRLDFGGAQQNTLHTVLNLDRSRYDCLLICGVGGTLDPRAREMVEAAPPLRTVFLESLVRPISPGQDLLALLQLTALFAAERPRIVHTHSSKAGILARLAAFAAGVPVILHTYHGFGFNDYQSPWLKGSYVLLEWLCGLFTTALIFVSQANRDYAAEHGLGRAGRAHLIRSGIKLADFPAAVGDKAAKKASLGLGRHKLMVTCIGNLKPQKNPADFVAMAEKVAASVPDAEFYFVGDGPLRPRLEYRIIASGLHNRLTLAGWRGDAAEILAVTDVFVLTSLWEGLPRALVEAMKSGLPCVCYATDGVRDILNDGDNGFLVPVGNISGLAQKVVELLADEALRKRIGQKAAASIGEEFDIDLMVRSQEKLYEGLLAGR